MNTEHPIGSCVGEELDHTGRLGNRSGSAIGSEGKDPFAESDSRFLKLFLGLPHRSNLRMGKHHRRHEVIVHMTPATRHPIDSGHTILFRLMSQHGPWHTITDGPHAWGDRAKLLVDRNKAVPVGLDPDWVEATLFAWLARERLAGRSMDTEAITGARGPVLLGNIFRPG